MLGSVDLVPYVENVAKIVKDISMDRNLKITDARVAADAINNQATLITRDKKLRNFMNESGHSSKGF